MYFDYTNNDTSGSQQWLDWTPFNATTPTLGTTAPTFWVYLPGVLKNYFGIKFSLEQATAGQNSDSDVTLVIVPGKKKPKTYGGY